MPYQLYMKGRTLIIVLQKDEGDCRWALLYRVVPESMSHDQKVGKKPSLQVTVLLALVFSYYKNSKKIEAVLASY